MNIALLIRIPMFSQHLINPIFLNVHHPVPAFNPPIRPGLIQLATQRSIAECLKPVLPPAPWVPVINYYFYRHPSSPYAAATLTIISPGGKPPMATLSIDLQLW